MTKFSRTKFQLDSYLNSCQIQLKLATEKLTLLEEQKKHSDFTINKLKVVSEDCNQSKKSVEIAKVTCDNQLTDANKKLKNCQLELDDQTQSKEPSLLYEKKRKRIRATIKYLWDYVNHKLSELTVNNPNVSSDVQKISDSLYEYKM